MVDQVTKKEVQFFRDAWIFIIFSKRYSYFFIHYHDVKIFLKKENELGTVNVEVLRFKMKRDKLLRDFLFYKVIAV